MAGHRFTIGERDFLLDGEPFRIVSGALHYFRVHPGQWRDRIRKGRLMGLNTIETYVPWNLHEPERGQFSASGSLDLAQFLQAVADEGMYGIVRPGPYICAEFDGGGLPGWLFDSPGVVPRSREPQFFAAMASYLRKVLAIVEPLQIDRGGPVILLQVENEFGAYGDDPGYLCALAEIFREYATVPLTTVDQPEPTMLRAGNAAGLLATGSFGSRVEERLIALRTQQPTGPLMCSEFWCGWFDYWGSHHHVTDPDTSADDLDELLSAGASVNIYMLHGGTNFGLTNGANDKGVYRPTVTSLDYDAPLDEAGRPTEKFWKFRDVISRHVKVADLGPDELTAGPLHVPEPARLMRVAGLDNVLAGVAWTAHREPPAMDALGVYRGLCRYRTTLTGPARPVTLALAEVRDRAWFALDGAPVGVLARDAHEAAIVLPSGRGELTVLVEDEGRINYGPRIGEPKGLIGPATIDGVLVEYWYAAPVPLELVAAAAPSGGPESAGAAIHRARFELDAPADLAIDTAGLGKGIAWCNGFCLGRYWRKGPQRTLFVPAPVTQAGPNDVTLLELEALTATDVRFSADLLLGHTEL